MSTILIVPGLGSKKFDTTFKIQKGWLVDDGHIVLDIRELGFGFDGNKGMANNARAIVQALQGIQKCSILAHSKGGLDVLDALIRLGNDGVFNKVETFVALQSPFYGTPLADVFDKLPKLVRDMFSWDAEAMKDLTVEARLEYIKANESMIEKLQTQMNIVCCSTKYGPNVGQGVVRPALDLLNNLLWSQKLPNDGLVPQDSARLNFGRVNNIQFDTALDHGDIVIPVSWSWWARYNYLKNPQKKGSAKGKQRWSWSITPLGL